MTLIALITAFLIPLAQAGFDKGNGGDGFHCPKRTPSLLLAEEIESTATWRIELLPRDVDPVVISVEQAAQMQLAQLAPVFPQFTKTLYAELAWVVANRVYVYRATLDNLDDDVIAWIPIDCSLQQVAIQTLTEVYIQGDFWNKMDARTQSMLLTHEAIYRTLDRNMSKSLATSKPIRLLNSFLWRNSVKLPPGFDLVQELLKNDVTGLK